MVALVSALAALLLDRIARPARPARPLAALFIAACVLAVPALPDTGALAYTLALLAGLCLGGLPPFETLLLRRGPPPGSIAALIAPAMRPWLGAALILALFAGRGGLPPPWWCLAPLALGAVAALRGAVSALLGTRLDRLLGALALQAGGTALFAIGLMLLAQASDLPRLAALALAGLLLQLVTATLGLTLLALATAAIGREGGSLRLDRLGGLIHRMPETSWCLLIGLASLAALPPTAGFAAGWLLLQTAFAIMRAVGPALDLLLLAALAALGLAAGLVALASARLFAVACLGRPRTPRGAAANPPAAAMRVTLAGLATLLGTLALAPGLGMRLIRPALTALLPDAPGSIGAGPDGGAAAALLTGCVLAIALLLRWLIRRHGPPVVEAPPWNDGFAAPPPWLPFGDPALQANAASLAWPLAEHLPAALTRPAIVPTGRVRRRLARWRMPAVPPPATTLFVALVAALAWLWLTASPGVGR